jgi:hypothetical protein
MRMFIGCVMFALCSMAEAGTVKLMVEPALVGKEVLVSGGFNIHEPIMNGLGVNFFAGVDSDKTKLLDGKQMGKFELKAVMDMGKLSIQPGARMYHFPATEQFVGFVRVEYKL